MARGFSRKSALRQPPLATAVLLAFSAPLGAQVADQRLPEVQVQGSAPGDSGFRTESTRSATRTDTPLRDIPQFINEVPQSVIRSQGATNLTDALRNAPGISYGAAETGTQANQVFYLRGFPLNADLYVDGVRDLGEYNRDLFATDSVEVLKGPSALLFGRGGSGGLINQTSKTADLLDRKELSVTIGSNRQKRAVGDLNVRLTDSSSLRVIAMREDSGSYRFPQGVEKTGLAPSFWTRLSSGTEVTLSYYYLKTHDVTDYGIPTIPVARTGTGSFGMPNVSADKYYGFANHDYTDHETNIATLKVEHDFNERLNLRNTLRWANYRRQVEATIATVRATDANGAVLTPSTPDSLLVVTRNHDGGRTRDNDDNALINQTDVTWKFEGFGLKHTLVTGVEIARERLNRWNYTLDANPALAGVQIPTATTSLLDPDPSTALSYIKTPNQRGLADADSFAVYAQDQIEISRNWKALGGLRWERFKSTAVTENMQSGNPAAGPFARTDRMVSGRGALIWQPSDAQSYYVSYANSFNPRGELGIYGGTANTNLSLVNQGFEPEENRNYEVGATWELTGSMQLRSALFRTEKKNQIVNNSITGLPELAGKRRVDGVEFMLSGSLTPNWDVYGGLAFLNGVIVASSSNQGRVPLGVADWSGNVWSVYRLGGGWEVGGGMNASSGFNLTDANNGYAPSYKVFDATAAYVQKKYEVRLNVFNLADKRYYVGGYNNAANRVLPGQPRAVSMTVRYNYD